MDAAPEMPDRGTTGHDTTDHDAAEAAPEDLHEAEAETLRDDAEDAPDNARDEAQADRFAARPMQDAPDIAESPPGPDDGADAAPEPEEDEPPRPVPARRRELDPSVREVLRQEAEQEARAPQDEAAATLADPVIVTPPIPDGGAMTRDDAPAPGTGPDGPSVAETAAPGSSAEDPAADRADPPSRRALLPDIEEINSSLSGRPQGAEAREDAAASAAERRRNFRRGLALPVLAAALVALLYLNAPTIAARFPRLDLAMRDYVQTVDKGRLWLDLHVRQLVTWIEEKTAS